MIIKISISEWNVMVFSQYISHRDLRGNSIFIKALTPPLVYHMPDLSLPVVLHAEAFTAQGKITKPICCHASEPTEELWLGLNDQKTHFYFEWSDGTPVTFTKWQRRHPTYTSGAEHCAAMKGQVQHALLSQHCKLLTATTQNHLCAYAEIIPYAILK